MTLEIVILNQKRTFTIADSNVTINDCKTFEGEQKIFKISDRLSCVLLLSGNSEFDSHKMKNFIDEYVSKTNFNEINSIEEIRKTLSESIAKSSRNLTLDEYVESTFAEFQKSVKKSIKILDGKEQIIQFLKLNSFGIAQDDDDVDLVLTGFNDNTFIDINHVVLELLDEFGNLNQLDQSISDSISEELKTKIDEIKLGNLKNIIDYIKILPDTEILKLLDALIVLTSIKMKFSSEVHSVGEKRVKTVLRKYRDVSFFE